MVGEPYLAVASLVHLASFEEVDEPVPPLEHEELVACQRDQDN